MRKVVRMKYDFDTLVDRQEIGSMKGSLGSQELDKKGLIPFAGAEMDFKTAPVIVEALVEFAGRGIYGYTLPDTQYKKAIQWWMKKARNLHVEKEEILTTHGTIYSVGTAVRAFTQEGDGIIVMPPIYYRYEPRIITNGRKPVFVPLSECNAIYSIDFEKLEEAMREKQNKMLILCNPHNPTGKVFEREELLELKSLADKYGVIIFSDEIFGALGFKKEPVTSYVSVDSENGISCTSLGKVFNFTGVNHANVIIKNKKLKDAFDRQRIADHFGSIDPFFYSALIAGYSPEGFKWVCEMKKYVWENYLYIRENIEAFLEKMDVSPLEGGFTLWLDFRKMGMSEKKLTEFLEKEALMLLDKGVEYGIQGEGFARMNIAAPREYIKRGIESLKKAYDISIK